MTPSISVGSLQQGRKTLRAVLEILDGLWLDSTPDIEEDVLVSGTSEHRAIRSRALAARVKGQISVLLSRHPEDDTNSPRWVASYQDEVRRELKRYENVHQKNRSLSDLYAANHAQLSARFNIPSDQYLSALEITRRIYHGLHNESLGGWWDKHSRASNGRRASPGPSHDKEVDVSDHEEEHVAHNLGARQPSAYSLRQLALDRAEQAGGVFWPRVRGA